MATMEALGSSCTRGEISLPANAGRASGGVFQLVVNISVESAGHIGPSVIDGVVRVRRNINIERLVVPNTPSAHVDGGMSPSEPGKALRVQGVEHIIKGVTISHKLGEHEGDIIAVPQINVSLDTIGPGSLIGVEVGAHHVVLVKRVDDVGPAVGRGVGRD